MSLDHDKEKVLSNLELLKILSPYMKPYYGRMLIALLILPIGSVAYSVQPIIIQKAIDGPLRMANIEGLYPFVFMLIAAIIVHFAVQITQYLLMNILGQRLIADIRLSLFAHLEKLPMSFFDKTPAGRSITRITSDIEQLGESFAGGLITTIADAVNIIAIMGFMFYLNWKLSVSVIVLLYPMYLLASYFQGKYRKSNLIARKELSKLNSFLQQNVVGISVVHLLNSIKKNMRIFDEINMKFFKANDDSIKADSSFSASIEFMSISALAVLILLSGIIITNQTNFFGLEPTGPMPADSGVPQILSVGIVIAFLQYAQYLFDPIRNLSDRFTIIQAGFTAAERVSHLLNEPIDIKDPEDHITADSIHENIKDEPKEVEFKDVWFKYDTVEDWILQGLSFKIKPCEKVAIVGKTGAGKSTIIKLLSRLYEANKGEILLNDNNIKDLKQKNLREMISVIHQESYIFEGDLKSNIHLNRDMQALNMEHAEPFLEAFSLDMNTQLIERAANISAGEEQVVSFARAVVSDPGIIVLDEATANIDLKTEKIIQNSLFDFVKDRTAIIIAHRLETIKKMDRILVLAEGKLAESGSHDELIAQEGIYYQLYKNRI